MPRVPSTRSWLMALVLLGALLPLSCSEDSTSPPSDIDAVLAQARGAMEDELYRHLRREAENPQAPDDVDFTLAHQYYEQALELDNTHPEACFGAALTTLLILSRNSEVNAAFDEWKTYLDENTPFEVASPQGRFLGVPVTPTSGRGAFELPFDLIKHSTLACVRAPWGEAQPRVSEVQRILQEVVVPAVSRAIERLGPVVASESYVFVVSPRMQGDVDEEAMEIDHTDFLALRSACRLLQAASHIAVAYDLSFVSYDGAGLLGVLDQEAGTGATLRPGGRALLAAVPALCVGAVDDLNAAMTSLLNETDNQDDDFIKTDPDDLSRADVVRWQADYIPHLRQVFTGPTTHVDDWDGRSSTPDAPLTIDLYAFFTDPIDNLKAYAAPYAVEIDTVAWREDWLSAPYTETAGPVEITQAIDGWASCSIEYWDRQRFDDYYYGDPQLRDALTALVEARAARIRELPDWSGHLYVSASFSGQLGVGLHEFTAEGYSSYSLAEAYIAVPVIVWEANDYAQWTNGFPDPTIGGLLPQAASAHEILDLFGFDPGDWEKRWVLDWSD